MKLYTINNKHADTNANFHITAPDIGASEAVHTHPINKVYNLSWRLTQLSGSDHTHNALKGIAAYGSGGQAATKLVNFSLSGGLTLTVSNNELQFGHDPGGDGTEDVGYLKNANVGETGLFGIAIGGSEILHDYDSANNGTAIALIEGI
jgi:hypothetical protein